jgi:hypothetical protein
MVSKSRKAAVITGARRCRQRTALWPTTVNWDTSSDRLIE